MSCQGTEHSVCFTEENLMGRLFLKVWAALREPMRERDQPRWKSVKTLSTPPLMSTPKPQLSPEQPSMKKTVTDQKRSSTTKDIKKELQQDG